MAIVNSSVEINGPLEQVYALAKDIEAFPEFMPDVKSVKIVESSDGGNRTISEWVGIVKEFKLTVKWSEEDVWDPVARTCTFKLIKGDYSKYSGFWKFTDLGGKTRFDSEIEVDYDVPMIGRLIKGLIGKLMKQNVDSMLTAVKKKVESA